MFGFLLVRVVMAYSLEAFSYRFRPLAHQEIHQQGGKETLLGQKGLSYPMHLPQHWGRALRRAWSPEADGSLEAGPWADGGDTVCVS